MAKKEKTTRRRNPGANRRAGNNFELQMIKKFNEIGFNLKSSRSESKALDNNKIDAFDVDGTLPTNLQFKYTISTPNYFEIKDACTDKTKPFSIVWKKHDKGGKNSPGTIVMCDLDFFLELIKPYANGKSDSNVSESSNKRGDKS